LFGDFFGERFVPNVLLGENFALLLFYFFFEEESCLLSKL
jgi:hypothetical protein